MSLLPPSPSLCGPLLCALLLAGPAGPEEEEAARGELRMLCLRDGRTLWATVVGHGPETLEVERLEDGGRLPLPWSLVDPDQADELRLVLGYVDAGAEEITVDADRLVLRDGTEVVGRIQSRTDEHLWVKRATGTVPVAKALVVSTNLVRVPALDVFTRDELYQRKTAELGPALLREGEAGARAHVELARFAERLFDYERALEHFSIAAELDPGHQADAVAAALERTREKALLQEQADVLAEADLWRARGRYQRAQELLAAFPERFPGSPLLEDWNRLRERLERSRERALLEEVVRRWHSWAATLARRAARESEGFEAARTWVEERMADELQERVTADLSAIAPEIRPEEVRRLWEERSGGRFRRATYGNGTWLLGEERALARVGDDEEEAGEPEAGSQADARQRLEERIERYLRNQEIARKARLEGEDLEDPETFWAGWGVASRARWLLAHYVETSRDFRIERARFSNCRECGGVGTREVIYTGGALTNTGGRGIITCPTCHGIARVRRVRYR